MLEDLQGLAKDSAFFFKEVRGQRLDDKCRDIVAKMIITLQKRAQTYKDRRGNKYFYNNTYYSIVSTLHCKVVATFVWRGRLPPRTPQDGSELANFHLPDPDFELGTDSTTDDGWGCLAISQFDDFLAGRTFNINTKKVSNRLKFSYLSILSYDFQLFKFSTFRHFKFLRFDI